MNLKALFTYNFLLKLVALILAVITWLYVNGELAREFF